MAQRASQTDRRTQERIWGDGEGVWVACVGLPLKIEPRSFYFFLSPDALLGGHLIPPISVFGGARGASP